MTRPRLAVFDVDGTLVDSAGSIIRAMRHAFHSVGVAPPPDAAIRENIGLSLPVMLDRLSSAAFGGHGADLEAAYRDFYADQRRRDGAAAGSPLFSGAREVLAQLARDPGMLLGIATGKSRRGLEALLQEHDLRNSFATTQVADDHPSKPDPSMLWAACQETGVDAADGVMIGDTAYDIEMGRAAGFATVGVGWGYQPASTLLAAGADILIDRFSQLAGALDSLWERRA